MAAFEIVISRLNANGDEVGRRSYETDDASKLAFWYYNNSQVEKINNKKELSKQKLAKQADNSGE